MTSIVEQTAGVTRDRVTTICEIDDVYFELVDTGGHGIVDRDDLSEHVEQQILYAINQADLILFVVDARDGLNPLDRDTASLLRRHTEHVKLIANKVDEPHMTQNIGEFVKLGFDEPTPVSALHGLGRTDLKEYIVDTVRAIADESPSDPVMKIALVGKRNCGKSTFANALIGEQRVIVSEVPGTTRDSIDVRFERDGRTFVAIDTAGVRKKNKLADDIEYYSSLRAKDSITRADIVLFLIDSTIPIGQVDKKLGHLIAQEHKPCILVINKWDLAKGAASTDDYGEYLTKTMPGMIHAPIAFTSAVSGRNIDSVIDLASELFKQSHLRVGTGKLNAALKQAMLTNVPPSKRGRPRPKIFYATQIATGPPTIVVFVNSPSLITPAFERFVMNRLRENLPFDEIPVRLIFRARRASAGDRPPEPTSRTPRRRKGA